MITKGRENDPCWKRIISRTSRCSREHIAL